MRSRGRLVTGLALLVWLAAASGFAGVTAGMEPREIELGESTLLRVVVDGDAPADIDLAPLSQFLVTPRGRVVGDRSEANKSSLVAVYRFELAPQHAGDTTIPPLAVTVGAQTFHTPPLLLRVRPHPTPPPDLAGREFALDAQVSNETPYVGEQFRYTLRLFRSRAVEAAAVTPPEFPGFVVAALPGQRDSEITSHGRHFAVTEVDYVLTPTRPGRLDLAPGSAACREAVDPGRSAGAQSRECAGPPLVVTVAPLPPFPGPGIWSGLIGQMELTARLELPGPGVGAHPTLVATLSGRGNLPDIAPPPLALPGGLTARSLTPEDAGSYGPTGYQGTRTFRYLLSAMPPEGQSLPAISLTFFDPEKATYQTLRATPELPAPKAVASTPPAAPPLILPSWTHRRDAPLAWYWVTLLGLAAPGLFFTEGWWRQRRERTACLARLSPPALAEALRQACAMSTGDSSATKRALDRLERLLYSGRPVRPDELAAAMDAGRRVLRERAQRKGS